MIYLDHAATTPLRKEALEAMMPYLTDRFGNASAAYRPGVEGRKAVNQARRIIGGTLGTDAEEISFTSGGTEADNWAVKGTAFALAGKGRHMITTAIEHPAVLNSCRQLERYGFRVTYLDADRRGVVSPEAVRQAIRPDTILISVMYANNETGMIQPVREIGKIAKEHGIVFHSDAVQAYGHIPVLPKEDGIDLLSVSGHKFGGPKGCGFLYMRRGIAAEPLIAGGGQESGRRGGTEQVYGIAGMAAAAEIAVSTMEKTEPYTRSLRDRLAELLRSLVPGVQVHGDGNRLPGFLSVCFPGMEAEQLLIQLDMRQIYASGGSACASGSREPSHVLTAMGLSPEEIRGTLRLTIGEENTAEEMEQTAKAFREIVRLLRR